MSTATSGPDRRAVLGDAGSDRFTLGRAYEDDLVLKRSESCKKRSQGSRQPALPCGANPAVRQWLRQTERARRANDFVDGRGSAAQVIAQFGDRPAVVRSAGENRERAPLAIAAQQPVGNLIGRMLVWCRSSVDFLIS